jgi:hypothetical protein
MVLTRPLPLLTSVIILLLFMFSQKTRNLNAKSTKSGAAVADETLIHWGVEGLPFGGVGQADMVNTWENFHLTRSRTSGLPSVPQAG